MSEPTKMSIAGIATYESMMRRLRAIDETMHDCDLNERVNILSYAIAGYIVASMPAHIDGGHIDDEPTLYRVGKREAGRLLDGRTWGQMPGATTSPAAPTATEAV